MLADHNYRTAGHSISSLLCIKKSNQYLMLLLKFAGTVLTYKLHFKSWIFFFLKVFGLFLQKTSAFLENCNFLQGSQKNFSLRLQNCFSFLQKGAFFHRKGFMKTFCLFLLKNFIFTVEKYNLSPTVLARSATVPASCHKIPYFIHILNAYNSGHLNYQDFPHS